MIINESPFDIKNEILHYLKHHIFQKAGNWSNDGIRKYLI